MGTTNEKILEIENNGADLLIKKLASFGLMAYYPWKDGSDVHNVVTKYVYRHETVSNHKDLYLILDCSMQTNDGLRIIRASG